MWPFTTHRSILQSGILEGGTDWHCHILPGVDDGIRSMKDSLAVLDYYEQTGIKEVWLTPHIMEDCPNETAALKDRFDALKAAYQGPIVLHLAAENMIDALFASRLEAGDLLTIQPSPEAPSMLRVETSYYNPPMGFEATLKDISNRGYRPLLAHPERYVYMDTKDYERLKKAGVLFQLNLMSLAGMYGQTAARKAARLLQDGLYDYTGSDLHRLSPWQHAIKEKVLTGKQMAAIRTLRK